MFAFVVMDTGKIVLLCVVIVAIVLAVSMLIVKSVLMSRRSKKGREKNESVNTEVNIDGTVDGCDNVSVDDYFDGQLVMSRNVIYSVGTEGQIKAGKYALKCADDASAKFNVRVNGLVREYDSGDSVTLTDGDTLSPVSCAVILTALED